MTGNPETASEADRCREWRYPGARWWKVDLHAHTPASSDYGKGAQRAALGEISPEEWLLGFMRAGVDCVAVTDHNSGDWIDPLKNALRELEAELHPDFRPLCLFPGVEITASTGTHVLAILDLDRTSADVATLLGDVGYRGQRGACDTVAKAHPGSVAEAIGKAGGIPILAHVDRPSGAWELAGNTLTPLLDTPGLFAMEIGDPGSAKPDLYRQRKLGWAEVPGSDSHHPTGGDGACFPGSHYSPSTRGRYRNTSSRPSRSKTQSTWGAAVRLRSLSTRGSTPWWGGAARASPRFSTPCGSSRGGIGS